MHLPRSASWVEEMEKRSRRRIRDLVALAASQGLSQNEIGCARISMMARSTNAPCKGRIQRRKTTLHLFKSGLQRTAGPYKVPCVDGSGLARTFFTSQAWSVLPCVRPLAAVHMTAGHNALRGSGPGQKPAFDNAMALGGVDTYLIHKMMAARVTTAR